MPSPTQKMLKKTSSAEAKAVKAKDKEQPDLIVAVSNEIENLDATTARKMLSEMTEDVDYTEFKIGGILSVVQTEGWYSDYGFESFSEYVEEEFGMKYRKAAYLISIYNGLVEANVPWEKVAHLGWSKLKELAGLLNEDNVDEWVKKAEELSVKALIAYIKSLNSDYDEESSPTTNMTFKVHEDQKETIEAALAKGKKAASTDANTVALEMICLEYLGAATKKAPDLKEMLKAASPADLAGGLSKTTAKKVIKAAIDAHPELAPKQEAAEGGSLKDAMQGKELFEIMETVDALFPDANITIET